MVARSRRSHNRRSSRPSGRGLRARRGIALFVAMFMVVGIGALALSAIYLTANATLISKTYEKEDDLKYAAEAALSMGKAELNYNPAALPNTSYVQLLKDKTLTAADAQPVPGVTVNLYLGPTGSTTGQFGKFASLVAVARGNAGSGFVRRLELTQESFAKFAYWTNSEGAVKIVFGGNDQLFGPVWSNDTLKIDNTGATFHDEVGTAQVIAGANNGTFVKGYQDHQKPIPLPSLTTLGTLASLATPGGLNFTAPNTGDETRVRMRLEFVATDLNNSGDSTDLDEGFMRVYTANPGQQKWIRSDWDGSTGSLPPDVTQVLNCGDFHKDAAGNLKFFPWAVHSQTWFAAAVAKLNGKAPNNASVDSAFAAKHGDSTTSNTKWSAELQHWPARCFLGGDPHLVSVARTSALGYADTLIHKGGDDTTFTPIDQFGSWSQYPVSPASLIATKRPWDARYLYPLYRSYNVNTKGVIYVAGTVGISGVLRADVTLYSPNTIVILDDVRYANDPGAGTCTDMFGIIAGQDVVVADNGINTWQYVKTSGPLVNRVARTFDDTPDLYIHGVIMALGSFRVENYNSGPTIATTCGSTTNGRGCLFLTGGVIQNVRGIVGQGTGTGFVKRYSYDRCALTNPPPYFPTTGRFFDNRYYELDPVRFDVGSLFKSLTIAQ